ncbi:hypothetical protein SAMN05518672_103558 [Chitinophaga sp. CF118]|nr:hypothetical protein SAMN05518672_103558 [Chitinophaga sp. CF118]
MVFGAMMAFLSSNEGISTNILNDRLVKLSEIDLITYTGIARMRFSVRIHYRNKYNKV